MKNKFNFAELWMTFWVSTSCITILEAILGVIFLPDERFGYEAFFSPPVFGLLSTAAGIVMYSHRELSVRRVLIRKVLYLLIIEAMVFGLNYAHGHSYPFMTALALAVGIFLVFFAVHLILWINDRRSASLFNERLKEFQRREGGRDLA